MRHDQCIGNNVVDIQSEIDEFQMIGLDFFRQNNRCLCICVVVPVQLNISPRRRKGGLRTIKRIMDNIRLDRDVLGCIGIGFFLSLFRQTSFIFVFVTFKGR